VRILIEVVDAGGNVETPPDHRVHLIAFAEEQLSQARSVLAGIR
jgi:hypothetical protein